MEETIINDKIVLLFFLILIKINKKNSLSNKTINLFTQVAWRPNIYANVSFFLRIYL